MDGADPAEQQKEQDDDVEDRHDFLSFSGNLNHRHPFQRRAKLTCRKKAHAQFRSKMLVSSVEQIAALDVLQDRQINDNGIVAGDRELLGPWTG